MFSYYIALLITIFLNSLLLLIIRVLRFLPDLLLSLIFKLNKL